jgi:hypothetical protein
MNFKNTFILTVFCLLGTIVVVYADPPSETEEVILNYLTEIKTSIDSKNDLSSSAIEKLRGKILELSDDIDSLNKKYLEESSVPAVPAGAVIAFELKRCPSGWIEYEPAYGRFIRGIDKTGTQIDSDGIRAPGNIQKDQLVSHSHQYKDIYWSEAWGSVKSKLLGNKGDQDKDNKGYEMERKTDNTGNSETRPKNVALLYCIKQ